MKIEPYQYIQPIRPIYPTTNNTKNNDKSHTKKDDDASQAFEVILHKEEEKQNGER